VGNKTNLIEEIGCLIDFEVVREYTIYKGNMYYETSAKRGENIENAFKELTHHMITRASERMREL